MGIKLFIENGEPHRAVLVMDQGDVLECKTSGFTLNYDSRTFEGYIKVKGISYEMMPLQATKIIKSIEFKGNDHILEIMDKIDKIIPEQKIFHGALNEVLREGSVEDLKRVSDRKTDPIKDFVEEVTKETKHPALETKSDVKEKAKEEPKIEIPKQVPIESQKGVIKQESKDKPKVKFTQKIKDLTNLPNAFKNQKGYQPEKQKVITTDPPKGESGLKPEKLPEKKSDTPQWDGAIKVGIKGYLEKGLCLLHVYNNSKNEEEAVMLNSPRYDGAPPPLPFIFAKEGQGKYFVEGLLKHPRWQPTAGMFKIYPLVELDPLDIGEEALLVKDPKSTLNHMEKLAKANNGG